MIPGLGLAAVAVALVAAGPATPPPVQASPATGPVSALPAARVEALEIVVTGAMTRVGIPALSLAVGHDDKIVFANGYGLADVENFVAARADTSYRLASVSKTLTAVVVLRLAEPEPVEGVADNPAEQHALDGERDEQPADAARADRGERGCRSEEEQGDDEGGR